MHLGQDIIGIITAFRISKDNVPKLLAGMQKEYEVIAPVKTDRIRFDKIKDTAEIDLSENSYFPVKEYFFKKGSVLFEFDKNEITIPDSKAMQRVFFGLRRCDLNAIKHQDMAFSDDGYYLKERKGSILIGYHCNEAPNEFCFCGSLDLVDFHDLMFFDRGGHFLVDVGSKKGQALVGQFKGFFESTAENITEADRNIKNSDRLDKKDISGLYDHPDWKKGVDICFSCAACTSLCPTCYCFEIRDDVKISDLKRGERVRSWSSCQLRSFTRVAGDLVFRDAREHRFKHRIYHQLQYFKDKNGVHLCVGCGRCISGCPSRIDFVKILNGMK